MPTDIHTVLEGIRQRYCLPAIAGAVVLNGEIVTFGAVGVRKYGAKMPVVDDDKFHLGSASKSISAMMIARLVEMGKLSWTATLPEMFPEFTVILPRYRSVTLLHLLSHRAGLPFDVQNWPPEAQQMWLSGPGSIAERPFCTDIIAFNPDPSPPEMLVERRKEFARVTLSSPVTSPVPEPGTNFLYSNSGYMVAAACAERATGTVWEELIRDLVFRPLGMTTAGFGPMSPDGSLDQPWSHMIADGQVMPVVWDFPSIIATAGGIHMSIRDWARFIAEQLNGRRGRSQLLTSETFRLMHTPQFALGLPVMGTVQVEEYGLGWAIERHASTVYGPVIMHPGSNNLNYAEVWMLPNRDFGVMAATNIGTFPGLNPQDATVSVRDWAVKEYLS